MNVEDYNELLELVQKHISNIHFEKNNTWHEKIVYLYYTIVGYGLSISTLIEHHGPIGIPIVLRSMLEAYVDLKNLSKDETYADKIERAYLEQKLRFARYASAGKSNFLKKSSTTKKFREQVKRYESMLGKLNSSKGWLVKDKFYMAGMEKEYHTAYRDLCSHSHNNFSALKRRHLEMSESGSEIKLTISPNNTKVEREITVHILTASECLLGSSTVVHSIFETSYAHLFENKHSQLNDIMRNIISNQSIT